MTPNKEEYLNNALKASWINPIHFKKVSEQ